MKIEIRRTSFYLFSVIVNQPLVEDADHVPVVLTHNFRSKSDYRSLTAEGKRLAEALLIGEMIYIGTVRICEWHFSPQYSNNAFADGGGRFHAMNLLSHLQKIFTSSLEVVVFTDRLPAEVVDAFLSKEVTGMARVRVTFNPRRT